MLTWTQVQRNINTGKEKIYRQSIHYGVGDDVYTYRDDAIAAGLTKDEYQDTPNSLFVNLTKAGFVKLVNWLSNQNWR